MRLNKRRWLACVALIALATPSCIRAEEASPAPSETQQAAPAQSVESTAVPSTPTPEATAAPTAEPSAAPTAEPSAAPSAEPSAAPTAEPSAAPTAEPSAAPSAEPSAAPSAEPSATPSAEPSATPSAEPSVSPTPEPSVSPTPVALNLSVEGGTLSPENVWQVALQMPATELAFNWSAVEGAAIYVCEVFDAQGGSVASAQQEQCRFTLPIQRDLTGRFSLRVRAMDAQSVLLAEQTIQFELTQGGGGFGGGGFGGGGFGGGGGAPATETPGEGEQGFQVTPGEALTDSHSSGSGDMRTYGSVELTFPEAAVTILTLGDAELPVTLDGGSAAFTVQGDEAALELAPEHSGQTWTVCAQALETLERSGVASLRLALSGGAVELSTSLEFSGPAYAALRAQGFVSKDFVLKIGASGTEVEVDGQRYALGADGALTPIETTVR